jgi:hypothetical protein
MTKLTVLEYLFHTNQKKITGIFNGKVDNQLMLKTT